MSNGFFSKIVGVAAKNADGLQRQTIIRKFAKAGQTVHLRREPDNAHDVNAIATDIDCRMFLVFADRLQIGYLSSEVAKQLAPKLDTGLAVRCKVSAVTGTVEKSLGVNIQIEFD